MSSKAVENYKNNMFAKTGTKKITGSVLMSIQSKLATIESCDSILE